MGFVYEGAALGIRRGRSPRSFKELVVILIMAAIGYGVQKLLDKYAPEMNQSLKKAISSVVMIVIAFLYIFVISNDGI